jgi:hypothetical protein
MALIGSIEQRHTWRLFVGGAAIALTFEMKIPAFTGSV